MAVGTFSSGLMSLGDVLNAHSRSSASSSRRNNQSTSKKVKASKAVEDQNTGSKQAAAAKVTEVESSKVEVVSAGDQFVAGLGLVLTRWVEATSAMTETEGSTRRVTHFHSVRAPSMSIQEYLKRIHKYFFCSDECYVMALVYIDKVGKIDPSMTVCDLNVHRLLVLAVMLAAKFHDDVYYSNSYYAKVGGLCLKEVNALEAKLLKILDWKAFVDPEEYELYHNLVCQATSLACPSKARNTKEPEPEPSPL